MTQGAEGWSLSELATVADVDEGELRGRFPTEFAVFSAVICRDELYFEQAAAVGKRLSAHEGMMAVFEACVPNFDWSLWIELWSLAMRNEEARNLRQELDTRWREHLHAIVERGCADGEFKADDPAEAALAIGTLIDSMAVHATLGDTTVRPNYILDACLATGGALLGTEFKMRGQDEAVEA